MANDAPNLSPWGISRDLVNGLGDTAQSARYDIGALAQAAPGNTFQWTDGIFPSASSGSTILDFQVTPVSGLTLQINFGNAQIGRQNNGPYLGTSTAAQQVTLTTANSSNPRIDYVIIRSADPGVDSSPNKSWFPVVLVGTPAAIPGEPAAQLTDGDLLIAAVTVRTGTSTILAGDISDRRQYCAARGGVYVKSAIDTRPGSYPGQLRYNPTSKAYETWDADAVAWTLVVTPSVGWTQYTPRLIAAGTGTDVFRGDGATTFGRYQQVGKFVSVFMYFGWGSPPYNGHYGNITATMPSGMRSVVCQTQWTLAHIFIDHQPGGSWSIPGQGAVYSNTTTIEPRFPIDTSHSNLGTYRIATSQGAGGTGIPLISGGFPEGGELILNGTYEVQ